MKNLMVLLVLLAGLWQGAAAGELTLGWNKTNDSGWVNDMDFLPDNKNFILISDHDFQIRSIETGELVRNFPFTTGKLYPNGANLAGCVKILPDSATLLCAIANRFELRNLSDLSVIKSYEIPINPNDSVPYYIRKIILDPVRLMFYALVFKSGHPFGVEKQVDTNRIYAYDLNTLNPIRQITSVADDNYFWTFFDVSTDGKYIAAMSQSKSHIKVWSLPDYSEISDYSLYVDVNPNISDVPTNIQFSSKNTENIYFSGTFPQYLNDLNHSGLFIYNLKDNKIIDSTFAEGNNSLLQDSRSFFTTFDDENKLIIYGPAPYLSVINLINKSIECQYKNTIYTFSFGTLAIVRNSILFLAKVDEYYSMFKYDSLNSINHLNENTEIIYPNPTNNLVKIYTKCNQNQVQLDILNNTGQNLLSAFSFNLDNTVEIDFSPYPVGNYFINLKCGNVMTTYKVIKEK